MADGGRVADGGRGAGQAGALPVLAYGAATLSDVLPSVLTALGVPGEVRGQHGALTDDEQRVPPFSTAG